MSEYNITLELAKRKPTDDDVDVLMDAFGDFHPTIGTSPLGWVEVDITVQAETLRQAVATGLALGGDVVSVTGMTTAEFDRRPILLERIPELLSVPEVAARLGISRQAVLKQINTGTLPALQVGREWAVPDTAISDRPIVRYRDALDTWNLAAARHLGLNPDQVFDLDVDEVDDGIECSWKSTEGQKPAVGIRSVLSGLESSNGETTYTGSLTLVGAEAEEFVKAVGPKPELLTSAERARLEKLT